MHAAFWCENMQGVEGRLLSQAENNTFRSGVFAKGTVLFSSAWRLEKQTSFKQGVNALLPQVRNSLQESHKVYLENLFSLSI